MSPFPFLPARPLFPTSGIINVRTPVSTELDNAGLQDCLPHLQALPHFLSYDELPIIAG